uniref:Heparan-sulfate 6-O-sulfotransferase n=1 Tax=Gopherus evgoodei TaxID=1825980 RepID=A0A8C4WAH2_9SAUR
ILFKKGRRNKKLSCVKPLSLQLDLFPTPDPHYVKKYYFPVRALERALAFDMKGEDVIVFLHIQKTGGTTFGRHLVQNVRLEVPCDCRPGQKKCTCYRPNRRETWLFSRFSTGWSCGLHADWTELTSCVPGVLDKRESARALYSLLHPQPSLQHALHPQHGNAPCILITCTASPWASPTLPAWKPSLHTHGLHCTPLCIPSPQHALHSFIPSAPPLNFHSMHSVPSSVSQHALHPITSLFILSAP